MTTLFWTYKHTGDTAEHARRGVGPASDFATPMGTPVAAPFAGVVHTYSTGPGGYGLKLVGAKYTFVAQHLTGGSVKTGSRAWREVIALTGNSGTATTGPHIHAYIIVHTTGKRISFYEWLRDYVNTKPATSTPAKPQEPSGASKITSAYRVRVATTTERQKPDTGSKALRKFTKGTVLNFSEIVTGQTVTQNGVTSNQWGKGYKSGAYFWLGNLEKMSGNGPDLKPSTNTPTPAKKKVVVLTTGWYYYNHLSNALTGNFARNQMLPAGTYEVIQQDSRGPVQVKSNRGNVWVGTKKTHPKITNA